MLDKVTVQANFNVSHRQRVGILPYFVFQWLNSSPVIFHWWILIDEFLLGISSAYLLG
jgi:hypothetical protein